MVERSERVNNSIQDLIYNLEEVKRLLNQRDVLKIELLRDIQRKINWYSNLVAFSLPILILLFYFISGVTMHANQLMQSTILQSYIKPFVISFALWALGFILNYFFKSLLLNNIISFGVRSSIRKLLKEYNRKQVELEQTIKSILISQELKIPQKFVNVKSISYIIDVLSSFEVIDLKEAIDLLELELKSKSMENILVGREDRFSVEFQSNITLVELVRKVTGVDII